MFYGLLPIGPPPEEKEKSMKKKPDPVSIEQLEKEIDAGKEVVDRYFDARSTRVHGPRKVYQIKKTNLNLTEKMAAELDAVAESLNVSRQAVIKVILRQALDQRIMADHLAKKTPQNAG